MELKIKKETARKIYPTAPESLKEILVETFGEECFRKKDWQDFETFEDLCQAIGITEVEFNKKWDPAIFDPSTIAFEAMKVCTRAYNQDWVFNMYDKTQKKWAPIFDILSSGLGFSYSFYYYGNARTTVGSRLCFADEDRSNHAGRTFTKLFENLNNAKY